MPKIVIVIPCWKRADVLSVVSENLENFIFQNMSKVEISVVYIFSKEDTEIKKLNKVFNKAKYEKHLVYAPNNQLGQKLNEGINKALEIDFDYIMNMGSDDLIHPALIDFYLPYINKNVPVFGLTKLYFYSTNGETLFFSYYNNPHVVGAGRMLHKSCICKVIEKFDNLYDAEVNRAMDGHSGVKLTALGYEQKSLDAGEFPFIVDIKSGVNINSFENISNSKHSDNISISDSSFIKTIYPILNNL